VIQPGVGEGPVGTARRAYSEAAVEESLIVRLKEMELRARALEFKVHCVCVVDAGISS
jgi:hypothetical protein